MSTKNTLLTIANTLLLNADIMPALSHVCLQLSIPYSTTLRVNPAEPVFLTVSASHVAGRAQDIVVAPNTLPAHAIYSINIAAVTCHHRTHHTWYRAKELLLS